MLAGGRKPASILKKRTYFLMRPCSTCGKLERYSTTTYCYTCHKENSKRNMKKKYCPKKNRERALRRNYGITVEQYDKMLADQEGRCKICDSVPGIRPLCVDHCHETDKVRGLLCDSCNMMLGKAYDNPEILRRGAEYLTSQEEEGETEQSGTG